MINILLSLIFFSLAAACNACMDKLLFHFHKSIFNKLNPNFWDPAVSWKYAKIIPGTKYKVDAWHLFKSAMIIFQCLALLFAYKSIVFEYPNPSSLTFLVLFAFLGVIWNMTFNLFFNKVLSR